MWNAAQQTWQLQILCAGRMLSQQTIHSYVLFVNPTASVSIKLWHSSADLAGVRSTFRLGCRLGWEERKDRSTAGVVEGTGVRLGPG
jgi:hypothetical protein